MEMKLEVVALPVADVDVAKAFYTEQVGFVLDHDARPNDSMRVVQMTPCGSACSVVIGEGLPLGDPGSVKASSSSWRTWTRPARSSPPAASPSATCSSSDLRVPVARASPSSPIPTATPGPSKSSSANRGPGSIPRVRATTPACGATPAPRARAGPTGRAHSLVCCERVLEERRGDIVGRRSGEPLLRPGRLVRDTQPLEALERPCPEAAGGGGIAPRRSDIALRAVAGRRQQGQTAVKPAADGQEGGKPVVIADRRQGFENGDGRVEAWPRRRDREHGPRLLQPAARVTGRDPKPGPPTVGVAGPQRIGGGKGGAMAASAWALPTSPPCAHRAAPARIPPWRSSHVASASSANAARCSSRIGSSSIHRPSWYRAWMTNPVACIRSCGLSSRASSYARIPSASARSASPATSLAQIAASTRPSELPAGDAILSKTPVLRLSSATSP